jgi:hypothetical protein
MPVRASSAFVAAILAEFNAGRVILAFANEFV